MVKRLTKSSGRKSASAARKGKASSPPRKAADKRVMSSKSAPKSPSRTAASKSRAKPAPSSVKEKEKEKEKAAPVAKAVAAPKSTSIRPVAPSIPPRRGKANGSAALAAVQTVHSETVIPSDRKSDLKAQFAKLSTATSQISGLKRAINRNFYDVGLILNRIRHERLYEIKGYGSFESFVEREIDINKAVCLRSARIAEVISRDEAIAAGLERSSAAVAALDGELEASNVRPAGSPVGTVPLHKQ
jgi:hypothetical protein